MQFPIVDERIHGIGSSKLREMTQENLGKLKDHIYLIYDGEKPVAVLSSYETFMALQKEANRADRR